MKHRLLCALCAVSLAFVSQGLAWGQAAGGGAGPGAALQPTPAAPRPTMDGRFDLAREAWEFGGPKHPYLGARGLPQDVEARGLPVSLRFRRALTQAEAAERAGWGVSWSGGDPKTPKHLGEIYPARATWAAWERLRGDALLERAELSWEPLRLRPLETITAQQGTRRANARVDGADGEGRILAAIDSPMDPLHPQFFFADGGLVDWLDVDGDGQFGPGVDAVDLDGDGQASADEVARVWDSAWFDPYVGVNDWQGYDGVLDPSLDWVYADANGDGRRNYGRGEGFDEQTPAFGEPLLVADDANRNGRLDVGERLARLKTSKVRRVVWGETVFERGDLQGRGIIDAADDVPEDASHGTGVASILVGGQGGYHARVGLAPGAEYINYTWGGGEAEGEAFLLDAVEQGADLVVHEWSLIVGQIGDGSTNLEAAMDRARAFGVMQVCPAGNLNQANKHLDKAAPDAGPMILDFNVGEGVDFGQGLAPYDVFAGHVIWEGEGTPRFAFALPGQEPVELVQTGEVVSIGDGVYGAVSEGPAGRGFRIFNFYASSEAQGTSLPQGDWAIYLYDLAPGQRVVARITDYWTGWSAGISWLEPTRDRGSLTYPSTADTALAVAAFGGRNDLSPWDSAPGELRYYSGRGPRVDGAQAIDIAAPDDPLAAFSLAPDWRAQVPLAPFAAFGGTSGAGPHVAGTLALLKQQHPDWDPDRLEARLLESTGKGGLAPDPAGFPDEGWGHGKLDAYRALYGQENPVDDAPPVGRVAATRDEDGRLVLDAAGFEDPEGQPLQYRFDLDYDGVWELAWQAEPRARLDVAGRDEGALLRVRVDVRDPVGGVGGEALAFTLASLEPTPEPEPDAGPDAEQDAEQDAAPEPDAQADVPSGDDAGDEPDAEADAEADADDAPRKNNHSDDPCGCAVSAPPARPAPAGGLLLALLAVLWRKRKK